ncbi:acyl-CoA dehydratase activase, partial [candidate division CSSED10-310 bacterium]
TGSGRKFIGKVIGADLIIDEITAHARAAFELNNDVDTIIEIGGQDAKFTTLKNGMVTFSVMNSVCAAGTGSFIEEQAHMLGVTLDEYSSRAEHKMAPMASDRCTVFMERDINYYLNVGYSVDEVLASVLHSVRENYLTKVATEGLIGKNICFQGATAKNQALVAAFEQSLNKPIFVSQFCHLTGALGSALLTLEEKFESTAFKGLSLCSKKITVLSEVCNLCRNNCKIKKVDIGGQILAFGFLCGRDYETQRYVVQDTGTFSLIDSRKKCFQIDQKNVPGFKKTLGIPTALYLSEDKLFWKHFFHSLGIKTIICSKDVGSVNRGKRIADSEFCAPLLSFYGHVSYLSTRADLLFLPVLLDSNFIRSGDEAKQYCYFSQFASSLTSISCDSDVRSRSLMPEIGPKSFLNKIELYKVLKSHYEVTYWNISRAYEAAKEFIAECEHKLKKVYQREVENQNDIGVVFLGRPYTILDRTMNKRIPDIFASLEIKAFFQDMLTYDESDVQEVKSLLKEIPWNYATKIIEVATVVAKKRGLYAVYITSFKCGPDSFTAQYFKKIMELYNKPYLILQLDDHGSNVGHTTRIEAAIRSFRNHYTANEQSIITGISLLDDTDTLTSIRDKTLLLPSWDDLIGKMHEAILIRERIDAIMVPLTQKAVKEGPRNNSGQCLPVNLMFQSFVNYIKEHHLDASQVSVWIFQARVACNIAMYPSMLKSLFENHGQGLEKVSVYIGQLSFSDISINASINVYFSYMFGGMLKKMGCKIRPYEVEKGMTDQVIEKSLQLFYRAFLNDRDKVEVVKEVTDLFLGIQTIKMERPKIAILGDLYARDNEIMNQDLIKSIENDGGEVIVTPYNEYIRIIEDSLIRRWFKRGNYKDILTAKTVGKYCLVLENSVFQYFNQVLQEKKPNYNLDVKKILEKFNIKENHSGESFDNLLKIFHLIERYPDISLFVLANPAFCSAGMVTEAMIKEIEKVIEIPIVSLMYDGTGKFQNNKLSPYLYSLNAQ